MARKARKKTFKKRKPSLPFTRRNYQLFFSGLGIIILGYLIMHIFKSITLAPILLLIGYCVLVPVAILYKKRNKKEKKE